MKKIILLIVWVVAVGKNSFSQTNKIQKAWAFITESMPGMAMADENGNTINPQPVIQRFIYIETNYKTAPKVDTVIVNGVAYKSAFTAVSDAKHKAGLMYTSSNPVYIIPKKGNKLWRIDLQAADNSMPVYGKLKKIIVKGKLGATTFNCSITQEQRLAGPEYN
jgi:hypothetical protein